MVFRIKKKETKRTYKKRCVRASSESPLRLYGYRTDGIDLDTLFELYKLDGECGEISSPSSSRLSALWTKFQGAFAVFGDFLKKKISTRRKKKKRPLGDTFPCGCTYGGTCGVGNFGVCRAL